MNKYFVRYIADTSFSIKRRVDHVKGIKGSFDFSFPNLKIFGYEQLHKVGERYVFTGMAFDSYVDATSIESAQSIMRNALYTILDSFAYVSLSPWVNLSLVASYEANEKLTSRKSYYYFSRFKNVEVAKSIRPLEEVGDVFLEVFNALDKSAARENISASFHQLNKGLQANTDVDEFLAYWTGIEYLADMLNQFKGYAKVERFYICPNCGNDLTQCKICSGELEKAKLEPGKFKRVSEIAQEKLNIHRTDFNRIKRVRDNILHGGKWDTFRNAFHYKNLVRTLLVYCTSEILNLQEESVQRILSQQPMIRNKVTMDTGVIYSADLSRLETLPSLDHPNEQPFVIVKDNKEHPLEVNEDGSINISNTPEYLHIGNDGVLFNNRTYSIYSHTLSGVKKVYLSEETLKRKIGEDKK